MAWKQSMDTSFGSPDNCECVHPTLDYLRSLLGDEALNKLCEQLLVESLLRNMRATQFPYSRFVAAPPTSPTYSTAAPFFSQNTYQTFPHATYASGAVMSDLRACMENVSSPPNMAFEDKTYITTTSELYNSYGVGNRAALEYGGCGALPSAGSPGPLNYFPAYGSPSLYGMRDEAPPSNKAVSSLQHVPVPIQVSPSSAPTPPVPVVVERLQQDTYTRNQDFKGVPAGPVIFNEGRGVQLNDLDLLHDGGQLAFCPESSIGEKASLRFRLPGLKENSPQVRVRHGGRSGRPCTLREMAEIVRSELLKLLKRSENANRALEHRGAVVSFERIVLLRIEHVSQGSIQPILGIGGDGSGSYHVDVWSSFEKSRS